MWCKSWAVLIPLKYRLSVTEFILEFCKSLRAPPAQMWSGTLCALGCYSLGGKRKALRSVLGQVCLSECDLSSPEVFTHFLRLGELQWVTRRPLTLTGISFPEESLSPARWHAPVMACQHQPPLSSPLSLVMHQLWFFHFWFFLFFLSPWCWNAECLQTRQSSVDVK